MDARVERHLPTQFYCPITSEVMKDPVSTVDGHTYERSAITKWLEKHNTSPKTNVILASKELVPNHSLKQMIQENEEDKVKADSAGQMPPRALTGTSIAKLGECFKVMDKLRIVLDQSTKNWSPPSFVVFGDEDVGKSTLLNRIVGRPILPTGSGVCTRVAIAVRLRRTADETAYMWLSKDCAVKEERPFSGGVGTVANFFGLGGKSTQLDTKCNLALAVRNAMNGILSTQVSVTGVSTERFIVLELNGPKYPNLDLIDLPGMTREGERKDPSRKLTEMFIKQHKGRSVLLGVMAASSAPNLTTAMEIVGTSNLYGTTIGVLTKCDEVADTGLKKKLVDVVEHTSSAATKLDFGYFATMLDSDVNPDEDAWFASKNGVLSPILLAKRTGVNNLVDSMNDSFLKYVAKSWIPNTLKLLEETGKRLDNERTTLGLPNVPTNEEARNEVWRCLVLAIENGPCFAKFKVDLGVAWRNVRNTLGPVLQSPSTVFSIQGAGWGNVQNTQGAGHQSSPQVFSLQNLTLCATRISLDNAGLATPWATARVDVTNLVRDLQGAIVKMIMSEMKKESPMQLKRFPTIIAKMTTVLEERLEKSREVNFDPWFTQTLSTLQAMEFFSSVPHETQIAKLFERTLGFVGAVDFSPPNFTAKELQETCGAERGRLEKESADVTAAVNELKRLVERF